MLHAILKISPVTESCQSWPSLSGQVTPVPVAIVAEDVVDIDEEDPAADEEEVDELVDWELLDDVEEDAEEDAEEDVEEDAEEDVEDDAEDDAEEEEDALLELVTEEDALLEPQFPNAAWQPVPQ